MDYNEDEHHRNVHRYMHPHDQDVPPRAMRMEDPEDQNDDPTDPRNLYHDDASMPEEELNEEDYSYFEGESMAESIAESMFSSNIENSNLHDAIPDVMLLNVYCARAKPPRDTEASKFEAEKSWEPVRDWLANHTAEEVRAAAEQRGESGLTALHFACRHDPPFEVIDVLLSIAFETVQWPDSFGWLPIHYACASGSDSEVIKALAEAFPESKTTVDRRGRTPLHFALGDKPASPDIIFLLSGTGAAGFADEIGMLPLHYACAFGASEEVLYVLTDAYPDAIETKDRRRRTPLHFALSNAGRKTVPAAVRLLLGLNKNIVNSVDNGPLPLRVLSDYTATIKNEDDKREEKRESVHKCLEHLLHAKPKPTADFLTTLQSLPEWLSERAVVMPEVQNLLNEKISRRFPTSVLIIDFYVLVMIIVSYSYNVARSIEKRWSEEQDDFVESLNLLPLYIGGGYFLGREIIQIISLISLKSFNIWLYDPSNYLNVMFIFVLFFWTIRMDRGTGDKDWFRVGAAVSVTILWVKLLAYLRFILIDFAVFVGGVFYVVRRLAAFLTALMVILIAFAQMFSTIFQQSKYCNNEPDQDRSFEEIVALTRCSAQEPRPYCHFWDSFLSCYTMLLGEVDENNFEESPVATGLFIVFMFLCVILLANVLIAIVTDSYKVIQDQRAAIVFWTNRLDFVAEMDAIANGPWKRRLKQLFGFGGVDASGGGKKSAFGKELWNRTMELFEDDIDDGLFSMDFFVYTVMRVFVAIFLVPFWLLLGVFTFGWLWPPQVRESVFTSTVFKHSSDSVKEDELRKTQVKQLQDEVLGLKDELLQELALDRTQVVQMKSQVAERKLEISNELTEIKKIVAVLFERQVS